MGGVLRVDPSRLRTAAAAQGDVGTYVAAMATGPTMADAGTGMPGLLVESACHFAGAVFDTAAAAVHEDLAEHSARLWSAADRYHQIDDDLGRRLNKTAT
ncbi:type VII secretion target [Mycolicibacterium sp. P1-18]|uniref:type VII secretion target n=1 Tax=Mycolicibacterium sp. P1-18 TaxID=2024615 RepID=UPI001F5B4846|nr:type VII secretion target [Mycolicibacterium sp. P1-18]